MVYVLLTLNALLIFAMPILLGIWLVRRFRIAWTLFLLGAAGFVTSQLFHISFNQFVLNPRIVGLMAPGASAGQIALAALLLGLSAGVFEEVTRYVFFRFMKDKRQWAQGMLFGAGWGGVESIIVGLLAVGSLINVYLYQSGLIETLVSPEQLANNPEAIAAGAQQIQELLDSPPWMLLLGAMERFLAIILQLSLSILVLQVFVRKSIIWLFVAIGWHTLLDALATFGVLQEWNVLLIEGALGLAALISIFIIRYFKSVDELPEFAEKTA